MSASPKQVEFVRSLLEVRAVPWSLRQDVQAALARGLTHVECTDLIPRLTSCRRAEPAEDWNSPEGYDDSPDMGAHRFDGGGAW